MLQHHFLTGVRGVTAIVALCAALGVQAQTGGSQGASGQSTSGQSTGQQTGQAAGQQSGQAAGQSGRTTDPQSAASQGTAAAGGTLNAADQRMLKTMAINNLAEIEAARMAQSKTQRDDVRTFAQRMIDDHTKALEDVRQLAQTKGVALPTELDRANKRKAARLAALSGDAFDRAYMAQAGVADHKRNHDLLRQAQSRAKDPDLQALAGRTLPIVDQHLNSAQELHKNTAQGSSKSQGQTGSSSGKQD